RGAALGGTAVGAPDATGRARCCPGRPRVAGVIGPGRRSAGGPGGVEREGETAGQRGRRPPALAGRRKVELLADEDEVGVLRIAEAGPIGGDELAPVPIDLCD